MRIVAGHIVTLDQLVELEQKQLRKLGRMVPAMVRTGDARGGEQHDEHDVCVQMKVHASD